MDSALKQSDSVYEVPMDLIDANDDFNCRGRIDLTDVADLVHNIKEVGLIQPVTISKYKEPVNGKCYRLIAGFRRFKAHQVLKLPTIKATIREFLTEQQATVINLIENIHRRELNILQEARAVERLLNMGYTEMMIANELKQSRGWVQIRKMLCNLPQEIQSEVLIGTIKSEDVRVLHMVKTKGSDEQMLAVAKKMKEDYEKGKKAHTYVPKEINPDRKGVRKRAEIFDMQAHIQGCLGNNLATRALAWAAGEISDNEFYMTLEEYARINGCVFVRMDHHNR